MGLPDTPETPDTPELAKSEVPWVGVLARLSPMGPSTKFQIQHFSTSMAWKRMIQVLHTGPSRKGLHSDR